MAPDPVSDMLFVANHYYSMQMGDRYLRNRSDDRRYRRDLLRCLVKVDWRVGIVYYEEDDHRDQG